MTLKKVAMGDKNAFYVWKEMHSECDFNFAGGLFELANTPEDEICVQYFVFPKAQYPTLFAYNHYTKSYPNLIDTLPRRLSGKTVTFQQICVTTSHINHGYQESECDSEDEASGPLI